MNLSGQILSKYRIIGTVENGILIDFDETLLPFYLQKTKDVESWLSGRAIDSHRTNSRLLKKALRIGSVDDLDTVLRVHAATITDSYWFRRAEENLTWNDVQFKENQFDKLALHGDPDSFNNPYSHTPELTNIGSFEKCWRLLDGKWWMYKNGNELEFFSELFICEFGKSLGFEMAHYELDGEYIRSVDFTNGAFVNFESAAGLVLDDEDYKVNFEALESFSQTVQKQYIEMLYLDTLCFNMDRHTQNYGVLRDTETGNVLSMAPFFDHNIALISRGYPKNIERNNDKLIELFVEFLQNTPKAMELFEQLELPKLDEKLIRSCCQAVPIEADADFIVQFILNGEKQIRLGIEQEQNHEQGMNM